jgi:hypothetical protein
MSIFPVQSSSSMSLSPVDGVLKFDKLPSVVFCDMLTYFTFEELASLRQVSIFN